MSWTIKQLGITKHGGRLVRYTQQSGANAALNAAIPAPGANWRLVSASVAYSAAPTQTGVILSTVSGAGSAFDTQLQKGAANAQFTNFPDNATADAAADAGSPLYGGDDALNVNAPAGGAAITSAASIYIEVL